MTLDRRQFLGVAGTSLLHFSVSGCSGDFEPMFMDRNLLLPSTLGANSALGALDALKATAQSNTLRLLPEAESLDSLSGITRDWHDMHIQGIALRDDGFYVTTTQGHRILSCDYSNDNYYMRSVPPIELRCPYEHPGGIQTIGDHVAVPVYSSRYCGEVRYYDRYLTEIAPRTWVARRPYCVGVTNFVRGDGRTAYLLAVTVSKRGDRIWFYEADSEHLVDCTWRESPKTWWVHDADRRNWCDNTWRGCKNSMSLFSDGRGNIYLLALGNTGSKVATGTEFADLYSVHLDLDPKYYLKKLKSVELKKLGSGGMQPSARFGASARLVLSDNAVGIGLVSAGYKIQNISNAMNRIEIGMHGVNRPVA